jgi:hypothetical protein
LKFMIQSLMENEMKPPWIQNLTFWIDLKSKKIEGFLDFHQFP